jgi:signal transduction histidine kinase
MKQGAEEIAAGNLEYKIEADTMNSGLKKYADYLNNIGEALNVALEKRIQSERMKTELITNVSHDIKNPLTSIISYADLISKEECDCHLHKEYSEVLVNKSIHLKRLLEDIVEISKIETGSLDINLTQCNGAVLLSQLKGEFEERCKNAGLILVINQCDETANFKGDSRSIWRIFENMMSNICKYSMVGSRVYLDMNVENDDVVFTFKNTSREALNISVDELMERFVRGDKSRNTDGNGLGLSIADSLMKAQNGKMDIFIDGDLFKVTLKFKGV